MINLNSFVGVTGSVSASMPARFFAARCLLVLFSFVFPTASLVFAADIVEEKTQFASQFAYGVNAGDWSLTQYRVNTETGVLRHNGHLPVYKYPVALAIHPSKRFLITAIRTGNKVAVFRIDASTGYLKEIPQSPFNAQASSPYSVSIHPSGHFVYVAARWGGVVAYTMDQQSGVLTLMPGSPFAAQKRTRSVRVHPSGRFVYATNAHSNSISAYRVNEKTGALSPVTGSPFGTGESGDLPPDLMHIVDAPPEAGGAPFRVEIHPSGRYIFVTNRMGQSFSVFKVDADSGALTPLKGSPFDTGGLPYGVTVHPSGQFFYVTSWTRSDVWAYRFDEHKGLITPLPDSPIAIHGYNPVSITFNAVGTRAYVTNVGFNTITQFSVDTRSGRFTLDETLRTRYQPFYTALLDSEPVSIKQRFCCVVEGEKGQLRILTMDAGDGEDTSPSRLQKQSASADAIQAAVVDPRGRFVYMPYNAGDKSEKSGIAVYLIDPASGVLTLLPEHTFRLGFVPTDLAMDNSGRVLYAVNPSINSLGVFIVDPDSGALALPKIQSPPTGKGPVAIALDPVARFSFVANAKENTVSVYTHVRMLSPAMNLINREGSSFAVGDNPVALAVDPTGKFLVVANKGSNDLSVFTVHYHEGRLEAVKGSPFTSGKAPVSVAMHPSGKFVHVLNSGSGDISSYRINSLNGELSLLPHRVDAGKQPVAITLDFSGRFAYVRNKGTNVIRKYTVDIVNGQLSPAGTTDMGSIVAVVQ
ncbi:MAG: beta-propeller fold lactonase family protein [Gammaproteobacteria bacterium]|nr:beta-propeller fold lactonase family protein [Gammaproteobacteria bacterium]